VEFICHCNMYGYKVILWHADPLLGNDSEISNCTAAPTRQRDVNGNRGMFSVRFVPRCHKKDKLGVRSEFVGELVS
jgi:hypothetical protein